MGAFSTVYLVSEEKTRTVYAMKVISKSTVAKNKEQLQEEIKIHLRLRHENIIQLYHIYSEDGEIRLIM
jgi:serine/threonine protein kinase